MKQGKLFLDTLIKPFRSRSQSGRIIHQAMFFSVSTNFERTPAALVIVCVDEIECLDGQQQEVDLETIAAQEQMLFSYTTLVAATRDFHLKHKLGEGGFGPVYKVPRAGEVS